MSIPIDFIDDFLEESSEAKSEENSNQNTDEIDIMSAIADLLNAQIWAASDSITAAILVNSVHNASNKAAFKHYVWFLEEIEKFNGKADEAEENSE
jgi:hypothetical protein